MGLDIGVVEISYLDRPGQPMYEFMGALMAQPDLGLSEDVDEDDSCWDGGNNGENAFYEFTREGLVNRATGWASSRNLNSEDTARLLGWIEGLPYRGDFIMLHLGW